jgi:cytochrome c5
MNRRSLLASAVVVAAIVVPQLKAQPPATPLPAAQAGKKQSAQASQQHQDEGQRIFEANCSRCHTAPEGFSPNISGTIVRHMRVRASLSKHDEEQLLRFFNP